MPPLERDEEVKLEPEETTGKGMKWNQKKKKNTGTKLRILIPNKLLTRLPILLAQINARNNSEK